MNDGKLSQEEIDALMNIGGEDEDNQQTHENELSSIEMDALGEVGNISFGSAATSLSTLLDQKVEITTPIVDVIKKEDMEENGFTFDPVSIKVNYLEGFSGDNVFVIKARDAAVIADIMLGGDGMSPPERLNDIHLSAVQEAMNQMMGAAATSMSTVFDKRVDISPPSILVGEEDERDVKEVFNEDAYIKIFFRLIVGDLIDSNIMQLIPMDFGKEMVDQLLFDSDSGSDQSPTNAEDPLQSFNNETETEDYSYMSNPISETQSESRQPDPREEKTQYLGKDVNSQTTVQEASFADFEKVELSGNEQRNLDMLLDIPLKVTVELGKTKRTIKDILDLSSGSIVELDKLAGEPVDILVNGKLIAEGEVVVIDENFGVRVTDILNMSDRIMKLK